MSAAYDTGSWSSEGQATHREISQRSGGIRGHLDLFILPEACAHRSIGQACVWCDTREAAIESALLGIRRELDQWDPNAEHRCFFRHDDDEWFIARCSCGVVDICEAGGEEVEADRRFDALFVPSGRPNHGGRWHARPGTAITPTSKQPELVRAEVGE